VFGPVPVYGCFSRVLDYFNQRSRESKGEEEGFEDSGTENRGERKESTRHPQSSFYL
jgi:hypothetical protein